MNTCDTCKFWGAEELYAGPTYRECQHEKTGSEHKSNDHSRRPEDGTWASAGDYYQATFETGPKFGCVHHEPK